MVLGIKAGGPPLRTLQGWDSDKLAAAKLCCRSLPQPIFDLRVSGDMQNQNPVVFAFRNPTLAQNARVGHPVRCNVRIPISWQQRSYATRRRLNPSSTFECSGDMQNQNPVVSAF